MTSEVRIRVLTQRDVEDYWKLRLEALEREPWSFTESAEEHRALTRERIAARLSRKNNASLVMGAFFNGELVGMAGFFRESHLKTRHKGNIRGVYVRANCRGKGLGRGLLLALLERVKKLPGLEQVSLSVSSSQVVAKALYRSLGFKTFGVENRALKIGNQYLDEEYMVLRFDRRAKRFSVMTAPGAPAAAGVGASTRAASAAAGRGTSTRSSPAVARTRRGTMA